MTSPSDIVVETAAPSASNAASVSATRAFYWSVRRELWENRSLYMAPVIVAGLVLFGFLIGGHGRGNLHVTGTFNVDPTTRAQLRLVPYAGGAFALMLVGYIVAVFYCLGALHNERRDRSILFWKSLPVSDLTTVLAKASIPMAVLPAILFAVTIAVWLIMLVLSVPAMLAHGDSAAMGPDWYEMPVALLYVLAAVSLWQAPIYGWLTLVSAWANRAPFLWAILPPLGVCIIEKIAFDTSYCNDLIKYRLTGWALAAFTSQPENADPRNVMAHLDPAGFLATPGLWVGLAVAAAFFAAAVRLRRYRGPI